MIYVALFIAFFCGVVAGRQGVNSPPVPLPVMQGLRCTNGVSEKVWDRMTAEGYMLRAQVAAETASRWVGVPAMKQAWAMESLAWSAIVRGCWE